MVRRPRRAPRRSNGRKVLIGAAAVIVVLALVAGVGAAWGLWSFNRIERVALDLTQREPTEPQNFLVVGSDSRDGIDEDHPSAGGILGPDAANAPGGRRADSLMIARVDPDSDRVDLLSVPRDLWVPIAGTGEEQRINSAYAESAQAVVDTVQTELGVPIHHFVEVDFAGFSDLVDSLGGVPMYFDAPVRDTGSGLFVDEPGCRVLNGHDGLAFARARHLQWNDGSQWQGDPTGDLGRMTRQQLLTRAAMARAQSLGIGDVGRLRGLVDAGVGSVRLDDSLGTGDLLDLGSKLSDLDPQRMQTHSLPVLEHRTSGGASVVLLDEAAAAPVLELFRTGAADVPVTTTTAPPPSPQQVTVEVHNGSGRDGEARRVSYVLVADGSFGEGAVESADPRATTVVEYPAGGHAMAELAAAWLGPAPELVEVDDLDVGTVRVTLGRNFERIAEPSEDAPTAASPDTVTDGAAGSTSDTGLSEDVAKSSDVPDVATESAAAAPTTTVPGWTPSQPPEGVSCP